MAISSEVQKKADNFRNDQSPSTLLQGFRGQAVEKVLKATGEDRSSLRNLGLKGYRTLHQKMPFMSYYSKGQAEEELLKKDFATFALRETRNMFVSHMNSNQKCFPYIDPKEEPGKLNEIQKNENKVYYNLLNDDVVFLGKFIDKKQVEEIYYDGEGGSRQTYEGGTVSLTSLEFEHGVFSEKVKFGGETYWRGILVEEILDCDNAETQAVGGRKRKTRRNKRKGGRKSRKMNKKTNKRRRSKKSNTRRSRK